MEGEGKDWVIDVCRERESSESSCDSFIRDVIDGIARVQLRVPHERSIGTRESELNEEIPQLQDLTLLVDPEKVRLVGVGEVQSVLDSSNLAVLRACGGQKEVMIRGRGLLMTDTVDEETVVFKKDGVSVGRVSDIFGPISRPFYTLRLHGVVSVNDVLYCVPDDEEMTKYLLSKKIRCMGGDEDDMRLAEMMRRGCDASWKNDDELPLEKQAFSDDEAERQFKRSRRKRRASFQSNREISSKMRFH